MAVCMRSTGGHVHIIHKNWYTWMKETQSIQLCFARRTSSATSPFQSLWSCDTEQEKGAAPSDGAYDVCAWYCNPSFWSARSLPAHCARETRPSFTPHTVLENARPSFVSTLCVHNVVLRSCSCTHTACCPLTELASGSETFRDGSTTRWERWNCCCFINCYGV